MSYDYGWQPYTYQGCQSDPDCLLIELDGLTFHGKHQPGAYYGITGFDGWDGGAETKGGGQQHETADGGYQTPVYLGGRSIVVTLDINASTHDELWQMRNDIGKILLGNRWAPLVVTDTALGLARQVDVRRSRPPKITNTSYTTATVTLELESASALRVDVAISRVELLKRGASYAAVNLGDANADLYCLITGPIANPRITFPAGEWRYTGTIPTGTTVAVDFTKRTVYDQTAAVHLRRNARGNWPALPPGATTFVLNGLGASSATKAVLSWRSSWV